MTLGRTGGVGQLEPARQTEHRSRPLPVRRRLPLGRVVLLPMLVQRVGNSGQPRPILGLFLHFPRGKELDAVAWRIAQRLEMAGAHEERQVVIRPAENACRFLQAHARRAQ